MKQSKLWLIAPALLAVTFLTPSCNKYYPTIDDPDSLNECSWDTIKQISKEGKARTYFSIGNTKDIKVNGTIHKVRIIGFDQDVDKAGNKIGITFEFENLLSDENGYALGTYWNDTSIDIFAVDDYQDSTLRAALNGTFDDPTKGSTQPIAWFEKDSTTFSTKYKNKSVLDMLPSDLASAITPASKYINIEGGEKTVVDKIFLLSPREMGYEDEYQEESTTAYAYYAGHTDMVDEYRIKHQPRCDEGAITTPTSGVEGQYPGSRTSYAGFDMEDIETNNYGGWYWLRSPNPLMYSGQAWNVRYDGTATPDSSMPPVTANSAALEVAPCFCI